MPAFRVHGWKCAYAQSIHLVNMNMKGPILGGSFAVSCKRSFFSKSTKTIPGSDLEDGLIFVQVGSSTKIITGSA